MPFRQLTQEERYIICHLSVAGFSQARIGRRLGRHRGTIGRELQRNRSQFGSNYFYDTATRLARERRDTTNRRYKLDNTPLGQRVRDGLRKRWSPEQIVGRLKHGGGDFRNDPTMKVTPETIYRWVYRRSAMGERWYQQLRRHQRKCRRRNVRREQRGRFPGRVGIEKRPAVVDRRTRFGDWEADTMQGGQGKGAVATHVERKSRYTLVRKLDDQRAETFTRATIRAFRSIPAALRKTMTCDNGSEFAQFKTIERRLNFKVYFANPYAAWERGTNENTNGLLRDFFPKGIDFTRVTHAQVAKAQRMLNNRPRKCLNYRTPAEVLSARPLVALRN